MSARQEPPDAERRRLRRVVEDVAGVERAEIDGDAIGRPVVRVHLDGSHPDQSVLDAVRSAVARWRTPPSPAVTDPVLRPRRAGLGKGLDVLLAEARPPLEPHPVASLARHPGDQPGIARIDVVRTDHGISVQAVDTEGTVAVVFAVDGDLERSVAAAVATLLDQDTPRVLGIDARPLAGQTVVTVAVETVERGMAVGSATGGPDHLLAVGRAVLAALRP